MTTKLIYAGNNRLQVGNIRQGDNNTYLVDILTVDNSLVETRTVSAATGKTMTKN